MSPDIEDLLRSELRGAASDAPHHLGVDDQDVLTRGRRVVRRRRALTAVGAVAATLAIAGTIGVLAPRPGDTDTLPALPTPTATPTPDVTPTITPSASVTATPAATVIATATPSATSTGTDEPSSAPSATPSATSTPSATPSSGTSWTRAATLGGVSYRTRLVNPRLEGDYMVVEVDIAADGEVIFTKRGEDYGEVGTRSLGPNVLLLYNVGPLRDIVSENGEPVDGEQFHTFEMPFPNTDHTVRYTIVSLPRPVARDANGHLRSLVVQDGDGSTYGLGIEDPDY